MIKNGGWVLLNTRIGNANVGNIEHVAINTAWCGVYAKGDVELNAFKGDIIKLRKCFVLQDEEERNYWKLCEREKEHCFILVRRIVLTLTCWFLHNMQCLNFYFKLNKQTGAR